MMKPIPKQAITDRDSIKCTLLTTQRPAGPLTHVVIFHPDRSSFAGTLGFCNDISFHTHELPIAMVECYFDFAAPNNENRERRWVDPFFNPKLWSSELCRSRQQLRTHC